MNKQQTAVEWLNSKIIELDVKFDMTLNNIENYWIKREEILEQAKALEKQQIIDAYETGIWDVGCRAADSEQYYQETFNK